ncbi:hypothetical protein [Amycolatopsis sp. w19]|uniref:hypothetical protein n=1 Tax=Amycolatopsis sp. w19 TaxID=3448134 RepID=UPI003F1D8BC6
MSYEVRDGRTTYSFEAANSADVRDGHLYVYDQGSNVLATFAPSHWTNATKTGTVKVDRPRVTAH